MKAILKYYCNPMILTVATVGYFYPLFLPLPSDGILRFLVGNVIAPLILLFVASACLAWLVAGAQVIMGIIGYRKPRLRGSITCPQQCGPTYAMPSS